MADYAWSDIYYGGKVENVTLPNGGVKRVVVERNIAYRGDKVTKKGLGLTDDEWDNLVENGSVRSYPVPEGISDTESPASFILRKWSEGGELQPDLLLQLSLPHSEVANESEETEEVSELAEA
jgi:hypothetical protein